jgi:hypothetical protein
MVAGFLVLANDLLVGVGLLLEFWRRRHNLPLRQSEELALHSSCRRQTPSIVDQVILLCISMFIFSLASRSSWLKRQRYKSIFLVCSSNPSVPFPQHSLRLLVAYVRR